MENRSSCPNCVEKVVCRKKGRYKLGNNTPVKECYCQLNGVSSTSGTDISPPQSPRNGKKKRSASQTDEGCQVAANCKVVDTKCKFSNKDEFDTKEIVIPEKNASCRQVSSRRMTTQPDIKPCKVNCSMMHRPALTCFEINQIVPAPRCITVGQETKKRRLERREERLVRYPTVFRAIVIELDDTSSEDKLVLIRLNECRGLMAGASSGNRCSIQ